MICGIVALSGEEFDLMTPTTKNGPYSMVAVKRTTSTLSWLSAQSSRKTSLGGHVGKPPGVKVQGENV